MNNHRTDTDWIEDFLEGTLDVAEEAEFKLKLESDPLFAKKYQQRLNLQEDWQASNDFQAEIKRVERIIRQKQDVNHLRRNIMLVAASVIIIAGIASILLFVVPHKTGQELQYTGTPADTMQKQGPQHIDIPKYAKSDSMKTSYGNVTLIFPENNTIFVLGDSIRFQWKSDESNFLFVIKEKETRNQVLRENLPGNRKELIIGTEDFSPGFYSWFVNDSMLVRQFRIK